MMKILTIFHRYDEYAFNRHYYCKYVKMVGFVDKRNEGSIAARLVG